MPLMNTLKGLYGDLAEPVARRYRLSIQPARVTVHGVNVDVDRSWFPPIRQGLYRGNYEAAEARVLMQSLRADDRYFEIGASLGVIMTIACGIVGDRSVIAYEANPDLVPIARRVAEINGYRPTVINAVLGESEEPVPFYVRDAFWESSLTPHEGARQVSVPGRLLAKELERADATYLMLDIEGAEIDLLRAPLPTGIRAVCMEVHPDSVGDQAVQALLQDLMSQGFILDTRISGSQVVFLCRTV